MRAFFKNDRIRKYTHDTKPLHRRALELGCKMEAVRMDTALAGYLLHPSASGYDVERLCAEYGVALGIAGFDGTTVFNVSGTSDLAPLDQQAEMLHTWFPGAKTVGLLYCSSEPNSQYQVDTVQGYLENMGYTCTQYSFSDSNDLSAVATTACAESDVLYVPTDNTAANNAELIGNIALDAQTPIIAGEEGICKGCGVATLTISYYDIGYKTGEMAYEILVNGADPATMPIEYAPQFTPKYNPTMGEALGLTPPDGYEAIAE